MYVLKIRVPEEGCRECPYLKEQIIDHNYYGEKSKKTICSIFDTEISEFRRCAECTCMLQESEEDIRKYVDYLVREINDISERSYCNAINDFSSLIKPYVNKPEVISQMAEHLKERAKA